MKKIALLIPLSLVLAGYTFWDHPIDKNKPVGQVLFSLGYEKPAHFLENYTEEQVRQGEQLVKEGRVVLNGEKTPYISKYYTCTSCHNIAREDPDLTKVDQDARLKWAMDKNLGYLQASTFWGIVNRETWYNDDYVKKYGDLVKNAEHSLMGSVQLCAEVCSAGRKVTDWEMERILAYFWSLQMNMTDLNLSDADWNKLNDPSASKGDKISLIKSKYLAKSPATFSEPPANKKEGYAFEGRPELGKGIFEQGCQHCHRPDGESEVTMEANKLTLRWLKKHITDNTDKSIYQIVRKGTYSAYGHQEYMPHYTQEKMSDQQLEDLRAFVEQGAR